jgi:hypothetical protein
VKNHCRSSLAATVSSTMLIIIANQRCHIRNDEYDKEINFSLAQKKIMYAKYALDIYFQSKLVGHLVLS